MLGANIDESCQKPGLAGFFWPKGLENNLKNVYHIDNVPSDTHMRKMLDHVSPDNLRELFPKIFRLLQRTKKHEAFLFLDEYYLVSCDGTGYFSSKSICCDNCMEKTDKDGNITYYHQFYGAAIVHPNVKTVIPLCPEPIQKQDGSTKNDCERNASKRFLKKFRKDYPKLKTIIIEDGLASNAPHIKEIQFHNMNYIIGVKPGDHKYLFNKFDEAKNCGKTGEVIIEDGDILQKITYCNSLSLNASNQDVLVNFIELTEINNKTNKIKRFTKITDLKITKYNASEIMRGGRARWKIENETFNTLKNQGYNFEHNFGHGHKHLSTNFAFLMMSAFMVDQILELANSKWIKARARFKTRKALWIKSFNYLMGMK